MEKAMQIKNAVLAALAFAGAAIAEHWGGWDAAMVALLSVMAVDFITGLMVAGVWGKSPKSEGGGLESKASFKGLCKKMVILLAVFVAVKLDAALGGGAMVRNATIFFFIGNEGLSVVENTAVMGVPWPPAMIKALEAMKKKGEDAEKDKA